MLTVDDQKRRARQRKVAHLLVLADGAELELLGREQEHRARHDWLIRLVAKEVADLAHLAAVQLALKCAGAALDRAYVLLDLIRRRVRGGSVAVGLVAAYRLASLAVEARLESDAL